jgi:hypothetical protein
MSFEKHSLIVFNDTMIRSYIIGALLCLVSHHHQHHQRCQHRH